MGATDLVPGVEPFAHLSDALHGWALDARFVEAFAIAGTAEDALAQARRYREAGTSELVLTFVGTQPEADMADLAHAVARA